MQPRQHQGIEVRPQRQRVQRRAEPHEAGPEHQEERRRREEPRPALAPGGPPARATAPGRSASRSPPPRPPRSRPRRSRRRAPARSAGKAPLSTQARNRHSRSGGGPSARAKASIRPDRRFMPGPGRVSRQRTRHGTFRAERERLRRKPALRAGASGGPYFGQDDGGGAEMAGGARHATAGGFGQRRVARSLRLRQALSDGSGIPRVAEGGVPVVMPYGRRRPGDGNDRLNRRRAGCGRRRRGRRDRRRR